MGMIKLSKIKPNEKNPRFVKDEKFEKLCKSIESFAEKMMPLRPIVIDENNIILGGNMRFKALKHLGYKEVPSDWIKQANDLTEEEKNEFIIKDNVGFGDWDWDILANEWNSEELEEWGLDIPNFDNENYNNENKPADNSEYTQKVDIPTYEPKNEKPLFKDLYNSDYFKKLIEDIESSDVTKEEKEFLKLAATRHIVFNYSKIADTYAHSNKNMQLLIEDSALVIIDYNKAIELGFVKLGAEISQLYGKDYPENEE